MRFILEQLLRILFSIYSLNLIWLHSELFSLESLLLQLALFDRLCKVIVNLCYDTERNQIGNDVLSWILLEDIVKVKHFSEEGPKHLHQRDHDYLQLILAPSHVLGIEGVVYEVHGLLDFSLDLDVQDHDARELQQ